MRMKKKMHALGGIIAISKDGDFGIAFNTPEAVWAAKKSDKLDSGMRVSEHETVGGLQ